MKTKLTDAFIQKHKIKDGERIEVFDTQVPGFGVRIGSRERAFFFVRRVKGRKVRMSLGVYPVMSLAKARSQALSILDRIKVGEDPTPELKRRKPQHEPAEMGWMPLSPIGIAMCQTCVVEAQVGGEGIHVECYHYRR